MLDMVCVLYCDYSIILEYSFYIVSSFTVTKVFRIRCRRQFADRTASGSAPAPPHPAGRQCTSLFRQVPSGPTAHRHRAGGDLRTLPIKAVRIRWIGDARVATREDTATGEVVAVSRPACDLGCWLGDLRCVVGRGRSPRYLRSRVECCHLSRRRSELVSCESVYGDLSLSR
jgi:hypothetical protein